MKKKKKVREQVHVSMCVRQCVRLKLGIQYRGKAEKLGPLLFMSLIFSDSTQ